MIPAAVTELAGAEPSALPRDLWRWPGQPDGLDVHASQALLKAIAREAEQATEPIGGLLLGHRYRVRQGTGPTCQVVLVLDRLPLEQEGAFDLDGLRLLLESSRADVHDRGMELVGWYRTHGGDQLGSLSVPEAAFHEEAFPAGDSLVYLVAPEAREAGFLHRLAGELLTDGGDCLAVVNSRSLAVQSIRLSTRLLGRMLFRARLTWRRSKLRDPFLAVLVALLVLGVIVDHLIHLPFEAWQVSGTYTIEWEGKKDATGYAIYRTADLSDSSPQFVTRLPAGQTTLDLTSRLHNLLGPDDEGKRFWYRVAAIDRTSSPYLWSRPITFVVPTRRPPEAPDAEFETSAGRKSVIIRMAHGMMENGPGYYLLREGPLPRKDLTLLKGGRPLAPGEGTLEVKDSPMESGAYRYLAIPLDWSGNPGLPWDSGATALRGHGSRWFDPF